MTTHRLGAILLTVLVAAASGAALTAPVASAHTCAAYDGCDASGCKDGEDHSHTDYNYWPKRDESCSSKKDPPPGSCTFNDVELPGIVCRLLGGGTACPRWNVPPIGLPSVPDSPDDLPPEGGVTPYDPPGTVQPPNLCVLS